MTINDVFELLDEGRDIMNTADNYVRGIMAIEGEVQRTRVLALDMMELQNYVFVILSGMRRDGIDITNIHNFSNDKNDDELWRELRVKESTGEAFEEWHAKFEINLRHAKRYELLTGCIFEQLVNYGCKVDWPFLRSSMTQWMGDDIYAAFANREHSLFNPERDVPRGGVSDSSFEEFISSWFDLRKQKANDLETPWNISDDECTEIWEAFYGQLAGTRKEDFMRIFGEGNTEGATPPRLCWHGSRETTAKFIIRVEKAAQGCNFTVPWTEWAKILPNLNKDSMKQKVSKLRDKNKAPDQQG